MNWKHAYLRKATDEELEFSGISPDLRVELQMWDGDLPELDEGVLTKAKNDNDLHLTEQEIRKDFDWAWQWKKEVRK